MLRTWRPVLNSGMNLGVDLQNVFLHVSRESDRGSALSRPCFLINPTFMEPHAKMTHN